MRWWPRSASVSFRIVTSHCPSRTRSLTPARPPASLRELVDLRPLHVAAAAGHVALVELLLRSGAELEALDAKKDRALHKACGALAKPAGDPKAKVPMATDECERRNARLLAVVQVRGGSGVESGRVGRVGRVQGWNTSY